MKGLALAPPRRHWRSYGTDPLPSGVEDLDEPFAVFLSWFLRITLRPLPRGSPRAASGLATRRRFR